MLFYTPSPLDMQEWYYQGLTIGDYTTQDRDEAERQVGSSIDLSLDTLASSG